MIPGGSDPLVVFQNAVLTPLAWRVVENDWPTVRVWEIEDGETLMEEGFVPEVIVKER
jgi:hypothetical protein